MCNRVTLREPPHDIARILELFNLPPQVARYNISPTQDMLIFRREGEHHEACIAHWGLQPRWLTVAPGTSGPAMFNARAETADSKPAFRQAFRERRCLIPVDGFYEWETRGKRKLPRHYTLKEEKFFALAGLYEVSTSPESKDEPLFSCTILTTGSNELLMPVIDRMPVILEPHEYKHWLDPKVTDTAELKSMCDQFPADKMSARPVNPYVNKSANEGPECLESPPPEPPQMVQGSLFE
jgi:putative SOS response-associated peptidase YedK